MALIKCPDCSRDISDRAAACIHCGAPLTNTSTTSAATNKVVTTQQTAKIYKGLQMLGAAMMAAGVVSCTAGHARTTGWLLIGGFFVFMLARVLAWWDHG